MPLSSSSLLDGYKKNRKQDSEFIGNEMNKKIKEKMDQMKLNKYNEDI